MNLPYAVNDSPFLRKQSDLLPGVDSRRVMKPMTSRERLITTLNHRQPDRVCVDFGGTWISGIHTSIVHRLKQRLIGPDASPARVHEPYQILAEVDAELRSALDVDVIGVWPRKNIFGYEASGWKPFTLFDGTPCLVPGDFNVTPAPDGGWLTYPEGDAAAPPSGHMPKGGYFFDTLIRQKPGSTNSSTATRIGKSSFIPAAPLRRSSRSSSKPASIF